MADTFNVAAALDNTSYNAGDTMTLTASGTVTGFPTESMVVSITVKASDGSFKILNATATIIQTPTGLAWAMTSVTDSLGHTWTIAADGKSATAVA